MATLSGGTSKSILQLTRWTGLNESPDGDTGLEAGEAAVMRNFRITHEQHLQTRPGYNDVTDLTVSQDSPVRGLWYGYVADKAHLLAACDGHLWDIEIDGERLEGKRYKTTIGNVKTQVQLPGAPVLDLVRVQVSSHEAPNHWMAPSSGIVYFDNPGLAEGTEVSIDYRPGWKRQDLGEIHDGQTSFFAFDKKVYLLTGNGYYRWTGTGKVEKVAGYIPVVMTATAPGGNGTVFEGVNVLNGLRRQRFSPDGTAKDFQLVETGIDSVISVEGTAITYTVDTAGGKVKFASAPPKGTNTITITYKKGDGERSTVEKMRFAELYGNDGRAIFYGDGSNIAVYTGLDENGKASVEYFPAMNQVAVGTANTPITAMIRHYDRLLAYKPNEAWVVEPTTVTIGGSVLAGFQVTGINRDVGCVAMGQARLVDNDPRTLFGSAVYAWPLSNYAVRDERNAKRISDRVRSTLARFELEKAITFDDNEEQEYYIVAGSEAVVHNYKVDAWYYYNDVPMTCMCRAGEWLLFGTPDGRIMHFSRRYRNSDKRDINTWWESGSMAFDREWMRKNSTRVWVGMQPETQGWLWLTAQTNRKSEYPQKPIATGLANFTHVDFNHFSFRTNRKPQVVRAKLKVKKATFYKLILHSESASATATIVSVDIEVMYTGQVK